MTPMMLTSRKLTGSSCCSKPLVLCLVVQSHDSARNIWLIWETLDITGLEISAIHCHLVEGQIPD